MIRSVAIFCAWVLAETPVLAGTYSITLTPEQETMLATVVSESSVAPAKYLTDAVAARLQADYLKAAGAVGSRVADQWPKMNAGQRTAVCAAAGITPCVGAPK
jgi:hypothetical protein